MDIISNSIIKNSLKNLLRYTNPQVRDFTEAKENELAGITKAPYGDAEALKAYFMTVLGRLVDRFSFIASILRVGNYIEVIKSFYGYTADTIHKIFTEARKYDAEYGAKVSNYVTISNETNALLGNLIGCLDISADAPDVASYTSIISERLASIASSEIKYISGAGEETTSTFSETISQMKDRQQKGGLSFDEIAAFVADPSVDDYFQKINNRLFDMSIDDPSNTSNRAAYTLGSLVNGDLIEWALREGGEHLVEELSKTMGVSNYQYEALGLGFDEAQIRRILHGIVKKSVNPEPRFDGARKEELDWIKKIVKGDEAVKDETKTLQKDFIKALGGIEAVKSIMDTAPDVLDWLYYDYSSGIETLEGLRKNSNRKDMESAILRLENDYSSRLSAVAGEMLDAGVEGLADLTHESISEYLLGEAGGKVVGDTAEVLEYNSFTRGYQELKELQKIDEAVEASYKAALEKARKVDPNDTKAYTQAMKDVETTYETAKQTTLATMKAYKQYVIAFNIDGGEQLVWVNDEIERLEKMSIGTAR